MVKGYELAIHKMRKINGYQNMKRCFISPVTKTYKLQY